MATRSLLPFLACLVFLFVAGCDDGDPPMSDAGPGAVDAGPPPTDAGPPAPMCPEHPLPPLGPPRCAAATRTCIDACAPGDDACFEGCLAADANPECVTCTQLALVSCLNRNGCEALWNCYRDCIVVNCSTAPDTSACALAMCATEDDAYFTCTDMVPPATCATRYLDCFPEM